MWEPGQDAETRIEAIFKKIQETVDPDSWKENGGSVGSLKAVAWALIVMQTPSGQDKVAAAMRAMP